MTPKERHLVASMLVGSDKNIHSIVNFAITEFEQTERGQWLFTYAHDVNWDLTDDFYSQGMRLNVYAEFETDMDAVVYKMRFGEET
jgi:hypothetical protein